MKNKNNKKGFKKLLFIGIVLYIAYTFLSQQKILNNYQQDKNRYEEQIAVEREKQEELKQTKTNIDSNEFIEEIAREKLDMYLPNEKLYIDISK